MNHHNTKMCSSNYFGHDCGLTAQYILKERKSYLAYSASKQNVYVSAEVTSNKVQIVNYFMK